MPSEPLVVVDLFVGAGGMSTGFAKACEDLGLEPGVDVELHAINHWEDAIRTHETNHPWAHHYHARVEELYPPDVVDPDRVDVLIGGPECTHFSNARGGKPVSDQRRASAWHVLDWIEKLQPEHVLIENVKEFRLWGPIDEDGTPSKDGSIFERWVGMLEALGYSVIYDDQADDYGVVLNAADYGDPQSRERLFLMASRSKLPTQPPQTHSDVDDALPDRRAAAEIIDWSDLGTSIWTRDLENPRVTPPADTTMARIAEGIRRHCSPKLAGFAEVVKSIDPGRLKRMREHAIPAAYADVAAHALEEPFFVHREVAVPEHDDSFVLGQHSTSQPRSVGQPGPTVTTTSRGISVCTPESFCLRQQSGGVPVPMDAPLSTISTRGAVGMASVESWPLVLPRNGVNGDDYSNGAYDPAWQPCHVVTAKNHDGHLVVPSLIRYSHGGASLSVSDPMPTIATEKGGTFALTVPYLVPQYPERKTQAPRTRGLGRPTMTIPASKTPAGLASPFLVEYYGNSTCTGIQEPVPTVTTRDRFALVVPEHWPWGLDIRYRMLQPDELKQAQGFPEDYEITGSSKKTQTGQIGNAVPVNLARNIVHHLLEDETPSLSNFGCGLEADPDIVVPEYEEVASDD